jgi:ABC-2 type transport system ATP-binding protein
VTVLAPDGGTAAPPGPMAAVSCEQITYTFGTHTAVDHLDLRIEPGETFGLLGPNGAGKTTTIRMLVTLLKPVSGRITVFGVDTTAQPMLVRRMIGYVPQLLSADGTLTGWENVQLFARLFDVPRKQRAGRVEGALAAMGLADAAHRRAATYSGGMIRRLELAQALVNAPRLLVLDEPTVGLDPIARTDVWDYITKLRDEFGMTVLALMHLGRIRTTGTPGDLKASLGQDVTLDEVFRHYTGGTLDASEEKGGIRNVRRTRSTARRLG